MNDATLLEHVEATFDGALPTLDAKDAVLGAPQSKVKSKTNVGKLGILLGVLAGFMLIIGGLLIYQKNRKTTAVTPTEKAAQAKPGFSIKNDNVSSDSIDRVKAELKKKDAEQQAQVKAIEEEQANVQKILAAEAEKRKQPSATPATAAQSAPIVNGQTQAAPVVARPPSPAERKMFGNVLLDSSGTKPSVLATATTTEQTATQREVAVRMAALGITPANSGNPAASAPTATASAPPSSNGITSVGGGSSSSGGGQGGESLASRLQPTVLAARSASKLPNLSFLLKKGTVIPCALKTGIDTTLPGFVTCNVLNDVYSADGKTVLVERGASIFGEQQSSTKQGQSRTFVVWSRVDNPSGVFANIDSPSTDAAGYSGIPGHLDNRFFERFGAAIMLSLVQDYISYAQAQIPYKAQLRAQKELIEAQKSVGLVTATSTTTTHTDPETGDVTQTTTDTKPGAGINVSQQAPIFQPSNATSSTRNIAEKILEGSINTPPRLLVLPATVVTVMLARDVSFENVFALVK
jgi:type IV secretion system protein VirB10